MPSDKPLLPVYLFNGDDQLKREQLLKRLTKRIATLGDIAFNRTAFDATKLESGDEVVDACLTMPFCSEYRLVVVESIDKARKPVTEAITRYLEHPSDSTVLALTAEKLARNTVLYKRIAKIDAKTVIDCDSKKRYELPTLVRSMATSHGATISQGAAGKLVEYIGVSTIALDTELTKLATYVIAQGRSEITVRDIDHIVPRTAEIKPWELCDALGSRDASRCMALIARMPAQTPYGLLAICITRVRELIAVKSLERRPGSVSIASVLGGQDWRYKNHRRMASNFTDKELIDALRNGAETEKRMKSGYDPALELDRWILGICRPNRP